MYKYSKTINRIKGGLLRAKMIGKMDKGNEEKKKRYGGHGKKKKKKKKKQQGSHAQDKGPETNAASSLKNLMTKGSLPDVKVPKGVMKRPSYIAAIKEANKHHGDARCLPAVAATCRRSCRPPRSWSCPPA